MLCYCHRTLQIIDNGERLENGLCQQIRSDDDDDDDGALDLQIIISSKQRPAVLQMKKYILPND